MRALFVTPMPPVLSSADLGGKHRRAGLFLRALARLSDDIRILCIVPDAMMDLAADPVALDQSQSEFWRIPVRMTLAPRRARVETSWSYYGAGILSAAEQPALYPFGGAALAEAVGRQLDTQPDLVFADRLDAMLPILAGGRPVPRLFMDVDDIYHRVRLRSALAPPFRLSTRLLALQAPALVLAERRAIGHATLAFTCSSTDTAHLRRLGFPRRIHTVPNPAEIPAAPPRLVTAPTVLYLGSFYHPPNVLAAERLIRQIWPRIRAAMPEARLLIAGAESHRLPARTVDRPGVEYLGFVDDLAALYAQTRLVCAPISTGSGTRLKLLEAAAHARPMVSTRIGAEGLDFRDGHEIMLREDDASLAEACLALLRDDALCTRYGQAAYTMARDQYEAGRIEQQVVDLMAAACGKP